MLEGNSPRYQPLINRRFSTYNGEPFAALYPQGPHFVAISFSPVRLSFRLYLPSANHPADQLQIVCCLVTYTRPKGRASAKNYTIQPEGSAKRGISSGLLVRRWLSSATCPQPHRAVLPDESWRSCESSTATAGHPTDERRRNRLRTHGPWPE